MSVSSFCVLGCISSRPADWRRDPRCCIAPVCPQCRGFTPLGNIQTWGRHGPCPQVLCKYLTWSNNGKKTNIMWFGQTCLKKAGNGPFEGNGVGGPQAGAQWWCFPQPVPWPWIGLTLPNLGHPKHSCQILSKLPICLYSQSREAGAWLPSESALLKIKVQDRWNESHTRGAFLSPLTMQEACLTNLV